MAFVELAKRVKKLGWDVLFVTFNHDEVQAEVRPDIAEKYGYESLDKVPSSLAWKSTAATHISAYNAVNRLTLVGSHYENISEKTRLDILIYAGNLMFRKKWDLDNIAPHVELGGLHE